MYNTLKWEDDAKKRKVLPAFFNYSILSLNKKRRERVSSIPFLGSLLLESMQALKPSTGTRDVPVANCKNLRLGQKEAGNTGTFAIPRGSRMRATGTHGIPKGSKKYTGIIWSGVARATRKTTLLLLSYTSNRPAFTQNHKATVLSKAGVVS